MSLADLFKLMSDLAFQGFLSYFLWLFLTHQM